MFPWKITLKPEIKRCLSLLLGLRGRKGGQRAGGARLVVVGSGCAGTGCPQNRAMLALAGDLAAAGAGEMLNSLVFIYIYLCTCA